MSRRTETHGMLLLLLLAVVALATAAQDTPLIRGTSHLTMTVTSDTPGDSASMDLTWYIKDGVARSDAQMDSMHFHVMNFVDTTKKRVYTINLGGAGDCSYADNLPIDDACDLLGCRVVPDAHLDGAEEKDGVMCDRWVLKNDMELLTWWVAHDDTQRLVESDAVINDDGKDDTMTVQYVSHDWSHEDIPDAVFDAEAIAAEAGLECHSIHA